MPALVAPRERLLCAVIDAREGLDPVALAEQACEALDGGSGRLRAAASRPGPVGALRNSFHEARCALEAAALANGHSRRVASYRDLGAFQLILSLQDDEALRLYCDSVLGPLEDASGEYGDELIRSLETYIEQNGQWERAARELYCHRHTLRYRIRRVEQLTGRDLSKARDRIEFWLALQGARAGEPMREDRENAMKVGVPTEIKKDEYRVSLTPAGVRELKERGHEVLVQSGAGEGSTIAGRRVRGPGRADPARRAGAVFDEAELVLGVKEPQPEEVALLRPEHTLFTYLHLAPNPELTKGLARIRRHLHRLRDGGGHARGGCRCSRRCRRWRARSPPRPARSSSRSRWAGAASCSAACPAWRPPPCS